MLPVSDFIPDETVKVLQRQHYALFGHSAVKTCHYTRASIRREKVCYKQLFYGIESHRCLQMTPATVFCNQQCIFCWRPLTGTKTSFEKYDEPKEILDTAIEKQRKLLSGLGGIKDRIDLKKYEEAMNPNQVAISLSGEPTFYPKLGEFIAECHSRGMSTFLVTNGTNPEALQKLQKEGHLPTQLYVSLEATSPEMHKKINVPIPESHWEKIQQTLELLPKLKTRTCIRVTAVKGVNMDKAKEFAEIIKKAKPDFVEVKSYMWIGFSRHRLKEENMPLHLEVKAFAEEIAKHLGYKVESEFKDSRVVLLWNGKTPLKIK